MKLIRLTLGFVREKETDILINTKNISTIRPMIQYTDITMNNGITYSVKELMPEISELLGKL